MNIRKISTKRLINCIRKNWFVIGSKTESNIINELVRRNVKPEQILNRI